MWKFIIDGILIAILLICIFVGIAKGFFDSIISLISTGLSLVAAVFLAKFTSNFINKIFNFEDFILKKIEESNDTGVTSIFGHDFSNVDVAKFCVWVCTVIILFLAIKLILFIVSKLFEAVVKNSPTISGINRVLGMLFGAAKGCIIVFALLGVCSLVESVPGIGDNVYSKIQETTITSKVYKFVDDFVEKNLTKEKIQSIVDKIISDNTEEPTEEEGSGDAVAVYR